MSARIGQWPLLVIVLLVMGLCLWDQSSARLGAPLVRASAPSVGADRIDGSGILLDLKASQQGAFCFHLVATVTRNGIPSSGVRVNFAVTSGPHAGQSTYGYTDVSGQLAWDICDPAATSGVDLVSATTDGGKDTVSLDWGAGVILELHAYPQATFCFTLVAALEKKGFPYKNVNVDFMVTSGPHAGKVYHGVTNGNGVVDWDLCGDGSMGVDEVRASALGMKDSIVLDWGNEALKAAQQEVQQRTGCGCYNSRANWTSQ